MAKAPEFDLEDPKYQCCCGCNIKQGVLSVGIIECVFLIINGTTILNSVDYFDFLPSLFTWVFFIFGGVSIVLLFVGFCHEDGRFLIPHMIYQVMLCFGAGFLGFVVLVVSSWICKEQAVPAWMEFVIQHNCSVSVFLAIWYLGIMGLHVWLTVLVFKGYKFFEAARVFYQTPPSIEFIRSKRKKKAKVTEDEDASSE